jgi:hypothetical protein
MLPFGVTIPATVPQRSEIPEGLMNYPVSQQYHWHGHITSASFKVYLRMKVLLELRKKKSLTTNSRDIKIAFHAQTQDWVLNTVTPATI